MKPLSLKASLAILYTAMLACLLSGLAYGNHRLLVRELEADTDATLEGSTFTVVLPQLPPSPPRPLVLGLWPLALLNNS